LGLQELQESEQLLPKPHILQIGSLLLRYIILLQIDCLPQQWCNAISVRSLDQLSADTASMLAKL